MPKKRISKKLQPETDQSTVVLGVERWMGNQAEKQHREHFPKIKSPILAQGYPANDRELYLVRPEICPLDQIIRRYVDEYAVAGDEERQRIRDGLTDEQFYTLRYFANRSAVFALREKTPAWVYSGFAAVCIIDLRRIDFRDIYDPIALLCHSAERLGLSVKQDLKRFAKLASPKVAKTLKSFASRSASGHSIDKVWTYAEIETEKGAGFIYTGMGSYQPSYALTDLAIRAVDLFAGRYQQPRVEIKSELKDVYFDEGARPALKKALMHLPAVAKVSARWRGDGFQSTLMLLYLAEARSVADAILLQCAVSTRLVNETIRRTVVEKKLFGFLIVRSIVGGEKLLESGSEMNKYARRLQKLMVECVEGR